MTNDIGFHSLREQLAGTMFDTAPTVDARQGIQATFALPGTIEVKYQAWRQTDAGAEVFAWIEQRALAKAEGGARRVGSKALVEVARELFRCEINNSFTAKIARDLVARHPQLAAVIELRKEAA